jgi:ABC-type transport system involved in multi-copper enzyme maturation permease subunit
MSILPVIIRELKAQARQPLTYWLRVFGGLAVAAAFAMTVWKVRELSGEGMPGRGTGGVENHFLAFGTALFGKLNLCIFLAIWVLVPLSTADAISRERREGTLALLFLTDLRSWGIVLGKASAHVVRALSLFLTMAPWLLLPLLFGGVELRDVGMALMLDSIALLLALAAGLVASAIPRDWLKSVIFAELLSLLLLLGMLSSHAKILHGAIITGTPVPTQPFFNLPTRWDLMNRLNPSAGFLRRTFRRIELTTNSSIETSHQWFGGPFPSAKIETHWQAFWGNLSPAGHQAWVRGVAQIIVQSAVAFFLALSLAAWCVRRSWRDTPSSARVEKLKQRWLLPRFRVAALRRNLSRSLTANPIGWLQHYSPSARMVKWGWCLFILCAEILLSLSATDLYDAQTGLGFVLLLGLTFSATASFRNELETGAFELLLVTPLRERQIIVGRLRGLWHQFVPALAIYGASSIYMASGWAGESPARAAWLALPGILVAFCALPIIGLYFSMQRLNFFVAWIFACVVGLGPTALAGAFGFVPPVSYLPQIAVGLVAGSLLEERLRHRKFR